MIFTQKTRLLAMCAFLAAVSFCYLEKQLYPLTLREEVRIVPDKEAIEYLCLDHRGFAADILFVKVNLHSGSLMWKPLKFGFDNEWSYKMMDLITDLDPKYYVAYLFSGMGLIHHFDDVKRAKPILEKGMEVFPDSWELPFWLGYDYYAFFEDYETAGKYLWMASQKPGAPKHFFSLLLSTLRKGGFYEKGLWVLERILEETKDERLKMVYEKKFFQLENLAFLDRAVRLYEEKKGHPIKALDDLIKGDIIRQIPEDPMGMIYEWDKEKNKVVLKRMKQGDSQ